MIKPILFVLSSALGVFSTYSPLREYAGLNFFDRWSYYGNVDNTTWGNATFLDRESAMQKRLTYVNDVGNAIIRVDNETTIAPGTFVSRDSIRIFSMDSYGMGSLIIIDALHIPFGCSVWPSFWTYGIDGVWPHGGEIDIIEGVNGMTHNQVAQHTAEGCFQTDVPGMQSGITASADCGPSQGCLIEEKKANSYGPGFAQAGGGVYALRMDETGIFTWFWSRPDVPASLTDSDFTSQQINTSMWGTPTSALLPESCEINRFFSRQNLVVGTTLCGVWAGSQKFYESTCSTKTKSCVADNVVGDGSNYGDAYWEIKYIRTYTSGKINNTIKFEPSATEDAGKFAEITQASLNQSSASDKQVVNILFLLIGFFLSCSCII